jgi:hypothetical protein
MSEIYPSVRTSIRHSVLQALYERPGAWLSTHELLDLSDELAQIPHPMAEELLSKFQELVAQYGYDEGTDEDLTYDTELITYGHRRNTGIKE